MTEANHPESSSESPSEPTGQASNPGTPGADDAAGRDIAGTISAIADQVGERVNEFVEKATPVVRDAAARASELVAKAGEAAGPAAHRAAEVTADIGVKVAAKGRDIAADLRRSSASDSLAGAAASATDATDDTAHDAADAVGDAAASVADATADAAHGAVDAAQDHLAD